MLLEFLQNYLTAEFPLVNLLRYISFRSAASGVLAFLIVVVLMPGLIRLLKKLSWRQQIRDDGPRSHYSKKGTPTMGGVLNVVAILICTVLFCRWEVTLVWISMLVFLSFGAVGFVDDYLKLTKKNSKGISARVKFISLGLVSLIAVYVGMKGGAVTDSIVLPFFKEFSIEIGAWIFLWGFLVLNGSANAVNLTDGLDGLAIVPVVTTAGVLLVISYVMGHALFADYLQFNQIPGSGELTVVMSATMGAGLGFLWYNSHPAQVFMGDVGSLSLGGLLGIVALLTKSEIVLAIAGFLFIMEAVSVMLQVGYFKTRKKRVLRMAPLHHHFELKGWPEAKVIVRFWILSVIFAIVALSTLKLR